MRQNIFLKLVFMGCILTLFTGCGAVPQTPSGVTDPSGNARTDEGQESNSYITVAEAKASVLENAGLLEENVRFVRFCLDSADGDPKYDIEFISENAEYDYMVNAMTGEILSMNYESGDYNIESVPPDITQPVNTQPANTQPANTPDADVQPTNTATADTQPVNTQAADTQSEADSQYIGIEAAKQAALYHAGLNADDVRFAHAHLEWEHGCWTYDVEFHKDNTEYDYSINALTGEILSYDHDTEHHHGADASTGSEQITADRAKQIALAHADVSEADALYLKVELDYDDGRAEYEVEWHVGQMEYSCDVDAYTGEILSFEKEFD